MRTLASSVFLRESKFLAWLSRGTKNLVDFSIASASSLGTQILKDFGRLRESRDIKSFQILVAAGGYSRRIKI